MPPNITGIDSSADLILSKHESEGPKNKLEILYDNHFYDVTEFVPRHPGGHVIKFYLEKGEDATQAIDQFHFRNKGKVESILKSFKRRPAPLDERGLEAKAQTRHEALSRDFQKLFEELKTEGYFEPDISQVILRLWECIATVVLAYGWYLQCETYLAKFLGTIFVGFAYNRFGWLMHEGGHLSLTGRPKVDKAIQQFSFSFIQGTSSIWWNSKHNRHHAMPQRLHHDVDLLTLPFLAFHRKSVTNKNEFFKFFVRYQALLYPTLDFLIVSLAWRFYLHPRFQLKKKAYFELLLTVPAWILAYHVGIIWQCLVAFWTIFFIGINFSLSHSHLDVADKPTHWLEYSLTHTANIESSLLVDWFMGYLNFQIEHHLFPSMPQFRQKQITHRVKALAEKHGLPYVTISYMEALKRVFKNLDDIGKDVTREDYNFHHDEETKEVEQT